MAYANIVEQYAAATRAELRKTVIQLKEQKAPTRASLKSGAGARGEAGKLAGLEIPYYQGVPHGETALDPISGTTSFGYSVYPTMNKMYVGLAFMGFTVQWEYFHETDAGRGELPETRFTQRDKIMATYMQHQNWYAIGEGNGQLAKVLSGGGTTSLTFYNDNSARGRSKGGIRLAQSPGTVAGKYILYAGYTSADVLTGTFYITARGSATTATIVVVSGAAPANDDVIVKAGHYKNVPYGLGYHIKETNRLYQGVLTTNDPFLNSRRVNGGNAAVTPTLVDTAKLALEVRGNDTGARMKRTAHLTHGNYRTLGAFGYTLRVYNAEKGQADTTYGMPRSYEDEDTIWVEDANMEDAYIYLRDSKSYFEYRQGEMEKISKGDGTQYVGTNSIGSTEFFDNYGEAFNLAWDARGDDGKGGETNGNSSVVIDNLAIPAVNQVSEGLFLV
jgi:hypothetical protein